LSCCRWNKTKKRGRWTIESKPGGKLDLRDRCHLKMALKPPLLKMCLTKTFFPLRSLQTLKIQEKTSLLYCSPAVKNHQRPIRPHQSQENTGGKPYPLKKALAVPGFRRKSGEVFLASNYGLTQGTSTEKSAKKCSRT